MPHDFSAGFKLTSRQLCLLIVFQISKNVERKHIIAVMTPCVTTPREDAFVHARKVPLGMEKTVQVTLLLMPL